MTLLASTHGKGRVRVMRVDRTPEGHVPRELSVRAMLTGDFTRAYTHADNSSTVSTDTIKNVVNIVARENLPLQSEPFCEILAARFLALYPMAETVTIEAEETVWDRIATHPHAFTLAGNGKPTVSTLATRTAIATRSGIAGFTLMKTTASGWANFHVDACTTLRPTHDRIAATSLVADWSWRERPADFEAARRMSLAAMLAVFADTYSASVQDSLYRMGLAALDAVPEIGEIALAAPNKHYIPVNLEPFGLDNPNAVFTVTDEPHGQIECVVGR